MTELRFDGRVAVVTGAGRGLGRQYALLLASRGAHVVVNDVGGSLTGDGADVSPAAEVVAEIKAAGGSAVVSTDTVATVTGGRAIIAAALDNFGRHSADLRRVEALMPDIVKLDSSIIGHSGHLSLARRVLMGLMGEFRRMGVVAVCQWVENPLQLQVARDVGVDWLQGRLLGRPQPRCVPTLPDRPRRERAAA